MAKEVAKTATASKAVAEVAPDYIKQGGNRGSEEVTRDDLVIPRLEVAQALSPCLKESNPEYIPGIKAGHIYNSVTRENYGPAVTVCPVTFQKQWLVWRDRKKGGGFRGAYNTQEEAMSTIAAQDEPEEWSANDTGQHLVLLVHDDGRTEEAIVSMSRTKLKVSRQWNALVRINGGDRFSRTYTLFTTEDSNDQGDFYNFGVQTGSWPALPVYRQAESLYNAVVAGHRTANMDVGDGGENAPASSTEY